MNAKELCNILAEQINNLRTGKGDYKAANSICNAAGKILATHKLTLKYATMTGQSPYIPFMESKRLLDEKRRKVSENSKHR